MLSKEIILKNLSKVIDPNSNKDIVSLGCVKNVGIKESKVNVELVLKATTRESQNEIQKMSEEAILSLEGVKVVKVNVTVEHQATTNNEGPLNQISSIIAISSCKGGVGKSTIAAHMAQEMAARGLKVGLIDTDVHGPSIPTLFDLLNIQIYTNENKQIIPVEKNNLKIMSFGFLLGDEPAVMRGPIVSRYVQQILHGTDWGELDYLIIDMPPGTGDIQLTITQSIRLSGAVIITTPQTLSLVDVSRGILMFEKVDVPIIGIIENMSYFICDKCGKKHYIFGGQANNNLSDRFGVEILAEFPLLPQFTEKINKPIKNEYVAKAVDQLLSVLEINKGAKDQVPEVNFDNNNVYLKWASGEKIAIANFDLRVSCRCAMCINEVTGENMLRREDVKKDIAPTEITKLGNYAIGISWNDGHHSGIYPYKNISELAKISPVN